MKLQSRIQMRGNEIGRTHDGLSRDTLDLLLRLHNRHAEARAVLLATRTNRGVDAVRPTLDPVVVRPRGLHQVEHALTVDGGPMSASVVDIGLHLIHCGSGLTEARPAAIFELPAHHHPAEERWWADVIADARAMVAETGGTHEVLRAAG